MKPEPQPQRSILGKLESIVGSCTCDTKTPEVKYHSPDCQYRKLMEKQPPECRCLYCGEGNGSHHPDCKREHPPATDNAFKPEDCGRLWYFDKYGQKTWYSDAIPLPATDDGAREMALKDVLREREAQQRKWGQQNHEMSIWMEILHEETGELCEADLHTRFGGPKRNNVFKEAVQVAAVALQIVEYLRRQPSLQSQTAKPERQQSCRIKSTMC